MERNLETKFGSNQLTQENHTIGTLFGVLGNLGYQELYLDLGLALVMLLHALNIEPGFGHTAIFLWQICVPLKLKA